MRRTHLRKNVWIGSVMIEESTYVSLPFGIYHELSSWPGACRTIDTAVRVFGLYLEDHLIRCVSSGLRLCTKRETQQYHQSYIGHTITCLWLCNRGQIEVGAGQCTKGLVLARLACDCEDLADVSRQKRALLNCAFQEFKQTAADPDRPRAPAANSNTRGTVKVILKL